MRIWKAVLVVELLTWFLPPAWIRYPMLVEFSSGRQFAGITVGPVVVQLVDDKDPCLEVHEYVHVNQWRRTGLVFFYTSYGFYYIYNRYRGMEHVMAYAAIPYEVDASAAEAVLNLSCESTVVESQE